MKSAAGLVLFLWSLGGISSAQLDPASAVKPSPFETGYRSPALGLFGCRRQSASTAANLMRSWRIARSLPAPCVESNQFLHKKRKGRGVKGSAGGTQERS